MEDSQVVEPEVAPEVAPGRWIRAVVLHGIVLYRGGDLGTVVGF